MQAGYWTPKPGSMGKRLSWCQFWKRFSKAVSLRDPITPVWQSQPSFWSVGNFSLKLKPISCVTWTSYFTFLGSSIKWRELSDFCGPSTMLWHRDAVSHHHDIRNFSPTITPSGVCQIKASPNLTPKGSVCNCRDRQGARHQLYSDENW